MNFQKIHNYTEDDFSYFKKLAEIFIKIKFHNDSFNQKNYEITSNFIKKIPKFPQNKYNLKKKYDLNDDFINLNIEDDFVTDDSDYEEKKTKKKSKRK